MSSNNQQQVQTLSEISENLATGSVAELYTDIRAVLGVDLVNLIYRHLATVPGALEWAWANLGPHFRSGELDTQAITLRDCVKQRVLPWSEDFAFALRHRADLASAARLTRVYTLNNSRNLIAFQHLLKEDAQGVAISDAMTTRLTRLKRVTCDQAPDEQPLPAIPSWEAVSLAHRETVIRLNRLGESQEPEIIASLYRHLSLWPLLLEDVEPALVQIDARGDIARAMAFTVDSARAIVQAHPLAMPVPAPACVDASMRARLCAFINITIPKMVPVGIALESAFTAPTTSQP